MRLHRERRIPRPYSCPRKWVVLGLAYNELGVGQLKLYDGPVFELRKSSEPEKMAPAQENDDCWGSEHGKCERQLT